MPRQPTREADGPTADHTPSLPTLEGTSTISVDLENRGAGDGSTIRGRVLDAATRMPIEGVSIVLKSGDLMVRGDPSLGWATSDAEGEFTLRAPGVPAAVLRTWHASYAPGRTYVPLGPDDPLEVEIELEAGVLVEGRVVNHLGLPVSDARVVFDASGRLRMGRAPADQGLTPGEEELRQYCVARCRPDGTFALRCLVKGIPGGDLLALAPDHVGRLVDLDQAPPYGSLVQVPCLPLATVTGRVIDVSGAPQAGLVVQGEPGEDEAWEPLAAPQGPPVTTAEDGSFRLTRVVPGCTRISVRRTAEAEPAATVHRAPIEPGAHVGDLEVVVPPHYALVVQLHDEQGHPLADEYIEARDVRFSSSWISGRTNERGQATLEVAAPGPWQVVRLRTSGEDVLAASVLLPAEPVRATLPALQRTTLRVGATDSAGKQLMEFHVHLAVDDLDQPVRWVHRYFGAEASAATGGIATFMVPSHLQLRGTVRAGHATVGVTIKATAPDQSLSVIVEPCERFVGSVRDDQGRPVPGATVRATSRSSQEVADVTTDVEGHFILGVDGEHWQAAEFAVQGPPGLRSLPHATRYLSDCPLAFVLPPGADLVGRLVGPEGVSLEGVELWAFATNDRTSLHMSEARTDASGGFRFAGVPPGWEARVSPDAEGLASRGVRMRDKDPVVRAGGELLEIHVVRGESIRGRIAMRDDVTEPLWVWARPRSFEGPGGSWATVDADGGFVLPAVGPGKHVLELWMEGDNDLLLDVAEADAGATDVQLRVPALAKLEIEVPSGSYPMNLRGSVVGEFRTALRAPNLDGGANPLRVVQGVTYLISGDDALSRSIFRSAAGSSDAPLHLPMATGLPLVVVIDRELDDTLFEVVARASEAQYGVTRDGREGRWIADIPMGTYELVGVGWDREERVLARGLRPDGSIHVIPTR
ncbi:MAG: hypothetical protein R3F05_00305 [Planctomycetota bacterium]